MSKDTKRIGIFDYQKLPREDEMRASGANYFKNVLELGKTLGRMGYHVERVEIDPPWETLKTLERKLDDFDVFLVHPGIWMDKALAFAKKYPGKKVAVIVQGVRLERQRRELPFLSYGTKEAEDKKMIIDFIEGLIEIEQKPGSSADF